MAATLAGAFFRRSSRPALAAGSAALLLIAGVAVTHPDSLAAQGALAHDPVYGGSFDRIDYEGGNDIAFGFRWTRLSSGPGGDVAVRLFPQFLPAGILAVGADLGAARAIPMGPATLLLRAGTSTIVVAGLDAHAFAPGLQAGLGVLIRVDHRSAVRLDLSRHRYFSGDVISAAWTLGLGFAVLPAAAGAGGR